MRTLPKRDRASVFGKCDSEGLELAMIDGCATHYPQARSSHRPRGRYPQLEGSYFGTGFERAARLAPYGHSAFESRAEPTLQVGPLGKMPIHHVNIPSLTGKRSNFRTSLGRSPCVRTRGPSPREDHDPAGTIDGGRFTMAKAGLRQEPLTPIDIAAVAV